MGIVHKYFECSVCRQRLQTTMTRSAVGTVYLGADGKPHRHEGTKWEAVLKDEEISLT